MKSRLLAIITSLLVSVGFTDDMPSEVKRLTTLRDKAVQKRDAKFYQDLEKLKKKYAANENYKGIVYIEELQATLVSDDAPSAGQDKPDKPSSKSMPASEKAARGIILPSLDFRDACMRDVVLFLRETTRRQDPNGIGINMSLIDSPSAQDKVITISLRKITLYDALNLMAEQANYLVEYQEAVVLSPSDAALGIVESMPDSEKKSRRINIPSLDFRDANIDDVIRFLTETARRQDPDGVGVNMRLSDGRSEKANNITISLRNMSLYNALPYITEMGAHEIEYKENGVLLKQHPPIKFDGKLPQAQAELRQWLAGTEWCVEEYFKGRSLYRVKRFYPNGVVRYQLDSKRWDEKKRISTERYAVTGANKVEFGNIMQGWIWKTEMDKDFEGFRGKDQNRIKCEAVLVGRFDAL